MTLKTLVLLLAAPLHRPDDAAPPGHPTDEAFALAVERSVRMAGIDNGLDDDASAAVRRLGSARYADREAAGSEVMARPDWLRCLFWAARDEDCEVRARARRLLDAALLCPHCGPYREHPGFCWTSGCGCHRPGAGLLCGGCGGLANLAMMAR